MPSSQNAPWMPPLPQIIPQIRRLLVERRRKDSPGKYIGGHVFYCFSSRICTPLKFAEKWLISMVTPVTIRRKGADAVHQIYQYKWARDPHCNHQSARARSASAITGRRHSRSGVGEDFLMRHFLYYENCRFSVTKSQKIDPKVRNPPSRRGLQTGHWRSPGSYSKKRIFGPKPKVLGPQNTSQFNPCSSHYRAKLCKEKSTLLPNKYHYFSGFRVSFLGTNRPCRLIWYPVGWLVGGCGEGCISQDTYLLYYSNH